MKIMNNEKVFLGGVYTVVVTPFDDENNINYFDLSRLINNQINTGVQGIILLGTTSESSTISENEKYDIVDFVWNNFKNKINIVIGIGGNNTQNVIDFGRLCYNKCNGFMVTVPYYNKPSQEGLFEHFFTIANDDILKNKEMMLYNIPSRCGVNLDYTIIAQLYNTCNNIVAIKEASGSLEQIRKIKSLCNIKIYSGDDLNILPIMSIGGIGVISVASNLIPKIITNIVNLCSNNNFNEAQTIFYKYCDLIESLFIVSNPIPIKYLLFKNNIINNQNVRLPLIKISNTKTLEILNAYVGNHYFEANDNIELSNI
jgi:4-hydroxy-tetrahydrodipicolinate synthase